MVKKAKGNQRIRGEAQNGIERLAETVVAVAPLLERIRIVGRMVGLTRRGNVLVMIGMEAAPDRRRMGADRFRSR